MRGPNGCKEMLWDRIFYGNDEYFKKSQNLVDEEISNVRDGGGCGRGPMRGLRGRRAGGGGTGAR